MRSLAPGFIACLFLLLASSCLEPAGDVADPVSDSAADREIVNSLCDESAGDGLFIDGDRAVELTLALVARQRCYEDARGADKLAQERWLLELAARRHSHLLDVVEDDPAAVARVAIPQHRRDTMPDDVRDLLLQELTAEGTLEVIYQDFDGGTHKLLHFLKDDSGDRLALHFANAPRALPPGARVRAQGLFLRNPVQREKLGELIVRHDDDVLMLADGGAGDTGGELAFDLPNALGAQPTLAILVSFQDDPSNEPWSVSQANDMVFGAVDGFLREGSSAQTWLTGGVAGWYTIPIDSTDCSGFAIASHATAAATADGYDLAAYDRFLYIFPTNSGCGYAGMGQVGASPSSAWINGNLTLRVIAHELGHNLGIHHSRALECGSATIGSDCTSQEYGDTLDIMGYPGTVGHFNGFQKARLGWLSSDQLIDVVGSGTHTLVPAAQQGNGAKILRILKEAGTNTYYYVEFRQPVGFDVQITDRGVVDPNNVFHGVIVHQGALNDTSYLLDMTPGSAFVDMRDAALTDGASFSDAAAGLTLTTVSTAESGAEVSVSLGGGGGGASCTASDPSISGAPSVSAWLDAGAAYDYTVTVTNNDSSACSAGTFTLGAAPPPGWTASYGSASVSLAPGQSASTSLRVTSPSSAVDGFYDVALSVARDTSSAVTTVTYVVSNSSSENTAPAAVDDAVVISSGATVVIDVLANDDDPDGDALTIVSVTQGSRGTAVINADQTVTYTPHRSFKQGDRFAYTVSDGLASATAAVTISVAGGGGGGGPRKNR